MILHNCIFLVLLMKLIKYYKNVLNDCHIYHADTRQRHKSRSSLQRIHRYRSNTWYALEFFLDDRSFTRSGTCVCVCHSAGRVCTVNRTSADSTTRDDRSSTRKQQSRLTSKRYADRLRLWNLLSVCIVKCTFILFLLVENILGIKIM